MCVATSNNAHRELPKIPIKKELSKIIQVFQLKCDHKSLSQIEQVCFKSVKVACKNKEWEKIESCKEEINLLTNRFGQPLLLHFIAKENQERALELIEKKITLQSQDRSKNNALHLAAQTGNVTLLAKLWEYIPIDSLNEKGETPFITAILAGQSHAVAALLQNGANANVIMTRGSLKLSPLALACLLGKMDCIDALLKKQKIRSGDTSLGNLLHFVIHFHLHEVLEHLLTKHTKSCLTLLEEKNQERYTPFAYAVAMDNPQALGLLQTRGANIEAKDDKARRPLHIAAAKNNHFMVRCLASLGCEVAPIDSLNQRPFDLATKDSPTQALLGNLMQQKDRVTYAAPQYKYEPPKNFIWKGGGAKGIGFIGAARVLKSALKQAERQIGTSAGAITADLLAFNYDVDEVEQLLSKTPLTSFLDSPKDLPLEDLLDTFKQNGKVATARQVFSLFFKALQNRKTFNPYLLLKEIWNSPGICKGDVFEKWIEEQNRKKSGIENCTFGELRSLILQGKPFKHLHIYASKITDPQEIVHMSSEDPKWDDVVISSGVHASMSIPGVFEPTTLKRKKDGKITLWTEYKDLIDGGLLNNLAAETCDEAGYIIPGLPEEQKRFYMLNKRSLAFRLVTPKEKIQEATSIKTIGDLIQGIINLYRQAEDLIRNRNSYSNEYRVIEIDTKGMDTLDFNATDEQKRLIIESGEIATREFLDKQEGVEAQSLFNYPQLRMEMKGFHLKSPHPHFTGRKELLSQLAQGLKSNQPIILYGPGGIGKTELALAYAHNHLSDYSFVFKLNAENSNKLENSYRELATKLQIYIEDKDDLKVIRKRVHYKLSQLQNWLLIYDNLEEEILFPKGGQILATCQSKSQTYSSIEVTPFTKQEAIDLLKQVTQEQESQAMQDLIEKVGCYPLILGQVASYIQKTPGLTIEEYLKTSTSLDFECMSLDKRYQMTLKDVFDKTMKSVDPIAAEWLKICSHLNPDEIPLEYLDIWIAKEYPHEPQTQRSEKVRTILVNRCLLRFDAKSRTFSMHRLFQEVLRDEESYLKSSRCLAKIIDAEGEEIVFKKMINFKLLVNLAFSVSQIVQSPIFKKNPPEICCDLLLLLGHYELFKVKPKAALEAYNNALKFAKTAFGEMHLKVAECLSEIGTIFHRFKDFLGKNALNEAKQNLEEALKIAKLSLEKNDHSLASYIANLGEYFLSCHNYKEAIKCFEEALEILSIRFGENIYEKLLVLTKLAKCLQSQCEYEEARKRFELVLNIKIENFGKDDIRIANALSDLAQCLQLQGKYPEALQSFSQALEILRISAGEKSFPFACCAIYLGRCLKDMGQYTPARKKFENSLEIFSQLCGAEGTVQITADIASCFYKEKEYSQAINYFQKSIELTEQILGKNHMNIIPMLKEIGKCYKAEDRHAAAIEVYQRICDIYRKEKDENYPAIAECIADIGHCLQSLNDLNGAIEKYNQALAILYKNSIENASEIAITFMRIAYCYELQCQYEEAIKNYQKSIEIFKSEYGENNKYIFHNALSIGDILNNQKKFHKAMEFYYQALKSIEIHSNNTNHHVHCLESMGTCFANLGKIEEAKKKYQEAYNVSKQLNGENHSKTKNLSNNLDSLDSCTII